MELSGKEDGAVPQEVKRSERPRQERRHASQKMYARRTRTVGLSNTMDHETVPAALCRFRGVHTRKWRLVTVAGFLSVVGSSLPVEASQ